MSNKEKYIECFVESLDIDKKEVNYQLVYESIPEWDSIGHMTLISGLEEGFSISMETDDIVDFSSYKKGKQILSKYKISF